MGNKLDQAIKQQPLAAMGLAILFLATNGVIAKLMYEYFPPLVWGFLRFAVAAGFFTAIAYIKYGPPASLPRQKLAVNGLLGVINGLAFFIGLSLTTALNASILSLLVPIIVYVGSVMFLKEPSSQKAVIGSLVSIIGGLLLFGTPTLEGDSLRQLIGIGLLLISFAALGATILHTKTLYKTLSTELVLGSRFIYMSVVLGLIAVAIGDPLVLTTPSPSAAVLLLFNVLIVNTLGVYIYYASLRHMRAEEAATMFYLDPLFAAFLSVLVLGETMSQFGLLASGFIVIGVLIAHPVHIRRMYFYENPALSLFDKFRQWLERRLDDITFFIKRFF